MWTISSSVLDVARCRLTLVSLVSEPFLHFHKTWLLIIPNTSQQFKQFLNIYPYMLGPI